MVNELMGELLQAALASTAALLLLQALRRPLRSASALEGKPVERRVRTQVDFTLEGKEPKQG